MNYRLILKMTSSLLLVEALVMALPLSVGLIYGEDPSPFLFSMLILLAIGLPPRLLSKSSGHFFAREGYLTVALTWLSVSLFGALPFFFSGRFASFTDCFFEAVSGFTTTGATILPAVEGLPMGILFWRSLTHWLGGVGVLVLAIAIFPLEGLRSQHLMQAESTGPIKSKLVPRLGQSSKIIYLIYVSLTAIEALLLIAAGMEPYDALVNSFSTMGTGGFSVRNLSIGAYNMPAAELIIGVFMLLGGTNFSVLYLLLRGRFKQAFKNDELRFYFGLIAGVTLLIFINLGGFTGGGSLLGSFFQVSSIITSTGFASLDYGRWPDFSLSLLVMLMLIGACSGSTGGGLKCSRLLIMLKALKREVHKFIHPNSVRTVTMDGSALEEKTIRGVFMFFFAYILLIIAGSLFVSKDNLGIETSLTSVISCVSNIGPALGSIGPLGSFAVYSPSSKLVLSLLMLLGRLEIYPMLVFFSPSVWRKF